MTLKIGIVGASGFTGRELAGLLAGDEAAEIVFVTSRQAAGKPCAEAGRDYETLSTDEMVARRPDAVFFCTPHGVALKTAPELIKNNIRVIDLSADFRFQDPSVFENTYQLPYLDPGVQPVYGLTEWFADEIANARLIANPGCYVTGALLSAWPVREILEWAVFDGKSGYSGAGIEKADALSEKLRHNFCAYSLIHHRHEPEIQQFLPAPIFFTPHLLPFFRGMEVTAHLKIRAEFLNTDFFAIYAAAYKNRPYVIAQKEIPEIRQTRNTNSLILGGFQLDDKGRLVITAVLDNLRKGAASQAVQNFHAMFGLPETIPAVGEVVSHGLTKNQ